MRMISVFTIACLACFSAYSEETPSQLNQPTPAPAVVSAESKSSNDLGKLSYLPAYGTLYFSTGLSSSTTNLKINGPAGVVADSKAVSTSLDYILGYGVSDYLALGVRGAISLSDSTEYSYGPGSTLNGTSSKIKRTGWYEPEFGAYWRVNNNSESKLRIAVGAFVRPKLQKSKSATSTSDGNQGSGNNKYSLSASIYKEVKNLEFGFEVERNFLTLSESESASNLTETSESEAHELTMFKISLQGNISETAIFGGGLIFNSSEPYKSKNFTNTVVTSTTNYDSSQSSALQVVGILKIENTSMLKFTVQSIMDLSGGASVGATKLTSSATGSSLSLAWIQEIN